MIKKLNQRLFWTLLLFLIVLMAITILYKIWPDILWSSGSGPGKCQSRAGFVLKRIEDTVMSFSGTNRCQFWSLGNNSYNIKSFMLKAKQLSKLTHLNCRLSSSTVRRHEYVPVLVLLVQNVVVTLLSWKLGSDECKPSFSCTGSLLFQTYSGMKVSVAKRYEAHCSIRRRWTEYTSDYERNITVIKGVLFLYCIMI